MAEKNIHRYIFIREARTHLGTASKASAHIFIVRLLLRTKYSPVFPSSLLL